MCRNIDDVAYGREQWSVTVPNTRSSSYTTNLNAYTLALEKRKNAITEAEAVLARARLDALKENAEPREEALARAEATIAQAQARLEALVAEKAHRTLTAPFSGTISKVDMTVGENSQNSSLTLVSNGAFELSVRIPEIDITRVHEGDSARAHFDAAPNEPLPLHVHFISPIATEIDGVSYYEALLSFDTTPAWLRGGFNADVDIITDTVEGVLRLP